MEKVTLVVTCCKRPDLLQKTLESFVASNTYPIEQAIFIEDSDQTGINDFVKDMALPFPCLCLYNGKNIGQIESIDLAYAHVTTPYIFHCEDDWEFFEPGFIEKSFDVLRKDPTVVTVQLRAHNDTNGHPIEPENLGGYHYLIRGYDRFWHGFTLNPALRRHADYMLVKPFTESCKPYMEGFGHPNETDISRIYNNLGYRGAILDRKEGHVRHIGWGRHMPRVWEH